MRQVIFMPMSVVVLLVTGCLGDFAANRQLCVTQSVTSGDPSSAFAVDTSKLPSDWLEKRSDEETRSGTLTQMRLAGRHPVKIIVVPLELGPSGGGLDGQPEPTTKPIE